MKTKREAAWRGGPESNTQRGQYSEALELSSHFSKKSRLAAPSICSDKLQKWAVLGALREHDGCTTAELAATIGMDLEAVEWHLRRLRRAGLVNVGDVRFSEVDAGYSVTWRSEPLLF